MPDFKGYIHDVGGPTANFRKPSCQNQKKVGLCKGKSCLAPTPCKNLEADHGEYLQLLRALRALPGVKKVFVRSGIRFDYLMSDERGGEFFSELVKNHISGQLKCSRRSTAPAIPCFIWGNRAFPFTSDLRKNTPRSTRNIVKSSF